MIVKHTGKNGKTFALKDTKGPILFSSPHRHEFRKEDVLTPDDDTFTIHFVVEYDTTPITATVLRNPADLLQVYNNYHSL